VADAAYVLATDYPSEELIENMVYNLDTLIPEDKRHMIDARGFLWGDEVLLEEFASFSNRKLVHDVPKNKRASLILEDDGVAPQDQASGLDSTPESDRTTVAEISSFPTLDLPKNIKNSKFNVILLCDVVFNHSEHSKLIKSCKKVIDCADGVVWVTFTHYRPWLKEKDLAFLELATACGFTVEHVTSLEYEHFIFPEDADDPRVLDPKDLRTVHAYRMRLVK
jgi:predicted nicotinamide N-methyase